MTKKVAKVSKIKAKAKTKVKVKSAKEKPIVDKATSQIAKILARRLDGIEKKHHLIAGANLATSHRQSTGLLVNDLILGGGLVPGMYAYSGPEGSAKSTLAMTTLGSLRVSGIPVLQYWDAEGSIDPTYTRGILKIKKMQDVFGLRSRKGWEIEPRCRYYSENILETFFDTLADTLNMLPNKIYLPEEDQWALTFTGKKADKAMMSELSLKPDAALTKAYGKYVCPVEDRNMQAAFVIDSWPSLVLENVDEEAEGSNAMALDARAFSKHLKRVVGKLRRKGAILIGVNQIRLKPATMFGCFDYHTRVAMADGSTRMIGEIVKHKISDSVLSYNPKSGKVEPKKIVNWFHNGKAKPGEFLKIRFNRSMRGHPDTTIYVTKGHKIFTPSGEVRADSLKPGSSVLAACSGARLNKDQKSLINGSLLGDGEVFFSEGAVKLQWNHTEEQKAYITWKTQVLNSDVPKRNGSHHTLKGKKVRQYTASSGKVHLKLPKELQVAKRSQFSIPQRFIDKLDLKSLAVWYMDDGNYNKKGGNEGYCSIFYSQRLDLNTKQKLAARITQLTGASCGVGNRGIYINTKHEVSKLHNALAPYIHPSMQYKVGMASNPCGTYEWSNKVHSRKAEVIKVIDVQVAQRGPSKFDLEIEGNHSYVVGGPNGIIVHNSPEYEPGGEALKFYSSVRNFLRARAVPSGWGKGSYGEEESVQKSGGTDIYHYKHIKNAKNKTYQPLMEGWSRVWVRDAFRNAHGFDPVYDTYQYLIMTGQLKGNKSKFTILLEGLDKKALTWLQFKRLILAEHFNDKELLKQFIKETKIVKPPKLRSICFKQLASGKFNDLLTANSEEFEDYEDDDDLEDDEE